MEHQRSTLLASVLSVLVFCLPAFAFVPGGTLDPTTIPKYVTPLFIPPEMPKSTASPAPAADYDIAVRQFKQQILPGGIWGGTFPATTVWSYGRAQDPPPDSSGIAGGAVGVAPAPNSSFNYPAFTVESFPWAATRVRWINDLKDPATGNFLPHLFSVDQTLHWANPAKANCIIGSPNRTDCETAVAAPYTGPVPMVTNVHGAHAQPYSDGYPEAWWLPAANNIPAGYATRGSHYNQADITNTVPGSAYFSYDNTQQPTTLWYHDHALGMTRLNVYAGPVGFWLIRGGPMDAAANVLPGPAPKATTGDPNFNATVRNAIREIPIVIQDRSFNTDGSLFYPAGRTFFDGFTGPYIGGTGTPAGPSDISPIWNPEAFFNTMVVNGATWPKYDVAPARYRLRLLDGCNSRFLNLSLWIVTDPGTDGIYGTGDDVMGAERPFYQIGGDQGFLRKVVMIRTGFATRLPGNGTIPAETAAPDPSQALLMGPGERADVIVDFSGLANGTRIRMINTGPDSLFNSFPLSAGTQADPLTTGQVMEFIVNTALTQPSDATSELPQNLVLPVRYPLGDSTETRQLTLSEMSSNQVCAEFNALTGAYVKTLFTTAYDFAFPTTCAAAAVAAGDMAAPMGPRQALLGMTFGFGHPVPRRWRDGVTELLDLLGSDSQTWEIYNTTVDAHPIHLHQVAFEVVDRQTLDPVALAAGNLVVTGTSIAPNANEAGFKDTFIALPGMVNRVKANFDIGGLSLWHSNILEREDNEMMRPYCVKYGYFIPADCRLRFGAPDKIGVIRGYDWYLDMNANGAWDQNIDISVMSGGGTGYLPITGHWFGSGTDSGGWFYNGYWWLNTPTWFSGGGGTFGVPGDIPVKGDWTGNGRTKIGVFRNGYWYLDKNFDRAWDSGDFIYQFGIPGDIPVAGDWNGDGVTEIGVFRGAGYWYLDANGNGIWDAGDLAYQFGITGDTPVVGDWTGDGKTKIGVHRGGYYWYLDASGDGAWGTGDLTYTFGVPGDIPVVGKW